LEACNRLSDHPKPFEVSTEVIGRRREALLGANLLLVNSAMTKTEARVFNPWLPKVEVTWLGVERQNEIADVGSNPPVGLIIGRMADSERRKGHDAVIDAWAADQVFHSRC
jgi:hypothetical protein